MSETPAAEPRDQPSDGSGEVPVAEPARGQDRPGAQVAEMPSAAVEANPGPLASAGLGADVGRAGKRRSPIGGWLLALVTFGVYVLFWYHHLNKELRDFDSSIQVRPGIAVLCLFVPIVNLVSIYKTGGRIRQAQTAAGVPPGCSGLVGMLLSLLVVLDVLYYNAEANRAWQAVEAG